jgi:hypothetical protein
MPDPNDSIDHDPSQRVAQRRSVQGATRPSRTSEPAAAAVLASDGRRDHSAASGLQLRRSPARPLAA